MKNIERNDNYFMETDDDWATAPPLDVIERRLFREFSRAVCKYQIEIHARRHTAMDTKIQRYFNSTPTKNTLARLLSLAFYDNRHYTKNEISEALFITRQAAHILIQDCLDEGWAQSDGKARNRGYMATPELIGGMENYVQHHFESVDRHRIRAAYDALAGVRVLRQVR
jgi:hypothetical protein